MPTYPTTTMEIDDFGSCCFSLDFESMLDAAEGAVHQQICEDFQGTAAQDSSLLQQQQHMGTSIQDSGCFSIPPYPDESGASFGFLPGETLQGDLINSTSMERRLLENGFHDHGFHIQRKSVGQMLPAASMGSCEAPHQVWSMYLENGNFDRAVFQHAPAAQPSLVDAAAPGGQACMPSIPGEYSSYETSCSESPIAASKEVISFHPHHEGKCQKTTSEDVFSERENYRVVTSKRAPDQAGHVIRERLRRDDMSSKFQTLESLLPPRPKVIRERDRATIVEDSIQYLENLHHRVRDLQQKRSEIMKARSRCTNSMGPGGVLDQKQVGKQVRPDYYVSKATVHPWEIDKMASETGNDSVENVAETCIEKAEVHLNLPEEMVIEMTCRPHAHIQSQVLRALERLRMDVAHYSISKSRGRILCFIVVQPQVIFTPPITSDNIIQALKQNIVIVK